MVILFLYSLTVYILLKLELLSPKYGLISGKLLYLNRCNKVGIANKSHVNAANSLVDLVVNLENTIPQPLRVLSN